jgi:hypothetical protein
MCIRPLKIVTINFWECIEVYIENSALDCLMHETALLRTCFLQ